VHEWGTRARRGSAEETEPDQVTAAAQKQIRFRQYHQLLSEDAAG